MDIHQIYKNALLCGSGISASDLDKPRIVWVDIELAR